MRGVFFVDALNRQQDQKTGFALAGSVKESIITIANRMFGIELREKAEVLS